jgi:hypothetical protein
LIHKQKHDPFAVEGETHCGDCNRLLVDKAGCRVEDGYFDDGVRCGQCYARFTHKKQPSEETKRQMEEYYKENAEEDLRIANEFEGTEPPIDEDDETEPTTKPNEVLRTKERPKGSNDQMSEKAIFCKGFHTSEAARIDCLATLARLRKTVRIKNREMGASEKNSPRRRKS